MSKKTKNVQPPPEDDELVEAGEAGILANLDAYLRECVKIDPLNIQGEFIRLSGDLAYWNDQYAEALRSYLTAEVDLKILKAQLEPIARQALIDAGGRTTEAQVKAFIEEHDQVIEAKRKEIDSEVEKARLYGVLDAIRSKKEMLVSLGAHLRLEMQGDPLLRDQIRHAREGS